MLGGGKRRYRFYPQERTGGSRLFTLVKIAALAFVTFELVSTFLIAGYFVETASMRPAFEPGDRILVSSLPFGARLPLLATRGPSLGTPSRGDLVLVETSYGPDSGRFMQPVRSLVRFFTADSADTRSKDWRPDLVLRRVIALPGDSVRMEDFIFYVRPEGSDGFVSEFEASGKRYPLVRETDGAEWARDLPFAGTTATVELADGEYFLATDNRTAGIDSRYGGPVERAAFRSRALLRYWPLDRFGTP